jgi:hypothetical protein
LYEKTCPRCEVTKPASEYGANQTKRDGLQGYCKSCAKDYRSRYYRINAAKWPEWRINRLAGPKVNESRTIQITNQEYLDLYNAATGRCQICGATEGAAGKGLHVDHDHATRKPRGLLCKACNNGLGMFRDKSELLGAAISYLEAHV